MCEGNTPPYGSDEGDRLLIKHIPTTYGDDNNDMREKRNDAEKRRHRNTHRDRERERERASIHNNLGPSHRRSPLPCVRTQHASPPHSASHSQLHEMRVGRMEKDEWHGRGGRSGAEAVDGSI